MQKIYWKPAKMEKKKTKEKNIQFMRFIEASEHNMQGDDHHNSGSRVVVINN